MTTKIRPPKRRPPTRVPWRIYSEVAPPTCRTCDLCGGDIAEVPVMNLFTDDLDGTVRVACDDCSFVAPHELRWRVLGFATEVERRAAETAATLRRLADRVAPGDRAWHDHLIAAALTEAPPTSPPNQPHQSSTKET